MSLISSATKLTPFQIKQLNEERWLSIHGERSKLPVIAQHHPIDRGVKAHGEGKRAHTNWSKYKNTAGVLPRALRKARSARFI